MSAENNDGHGFFAGLLMGGIIGMIIGLLVAPQPGEQTRAQLKGRLDEAINLGKSAWEEGKEAAIEKKEELKAKIDKRRG